MVERALCQVPASAIVQKLLKRSHRLRIGVTVMELSKGLRTAEAAAGGRHEHRSAPLHSPCVPADSAAGTILVILTLL